MIDFLVLKKFSTIFRSFFESQTITEFGSETESGESGGTYLEIGVMFHAVE